MTLDLSPEVRVQRSWATYGSPVRNESPMPNVASLLERTVRWVRLPERIPALAFSATEATKTKIRDKICAPLIRFVDNIALGFTLIKYPKKIMICMMYSLLVWIFAAFSYYVFSLGSPGIHLSYTDA